jgi:hypothetical protein
MRTRLWLVLLACCCAGVSACTASAPEGPDVTVTTPSVGRPLAPASAQAALSSEAFTPYAALGASTDDGLAPDETYAALHTACMDDAGYGQYADSMPYPVRTNRDLAFAQPYGPWGYIGTAQAAQAGFLAPTASDSLGAATSPVATLPAGAQTAAGKCANVVLEFTDAQFTASMAGIETMNDDISADVIADPDFKTATKAWSGCMARNGYTSSDADTLAQQELAALGAKGPDAGGSGPTAAQDRAQIATAVADADCTQSTDLAGIYFAVQASYEQQMVSANVQALAAAVREYKAAYAKELGRLPALLRTASATLQLPGRAGRSGPSAGAGPSRSLSGTSRATRVSIRVISSVARRNIGSPAAGGGLPGCRQDSANPRTMLIEVRNSWLTSLRRFAISAAERRAAASASRLEAICPEIVLSAGCRAANCETTDCETTRSGRMMARATASPATASRMSTTPATVATRAVSWPRPGSPVVTTSSPEGPRPACPLIRYCASCVPYTNRMRRAW